MESRDRPVDLDAERPGISLPALARLGAVVGLRRHSLDLTQAELGQQIGWEQERVYSLEHGQYGFPTLPDLARLAHALDVSLATLITAAGFDLKVRSA